MHFDLEDKVKLDEWGNVMTHQDMYPISGFRELIPRHRENKRERKEEDKVRKKNLEGGPILSWRGRKRLVGCHNLLELILVYWFGIVILLSC